ncbi:MAG: hypothetical protein Kow0099_35510 [Candidatus Abyssubacteria bacterium]
MTNKNIFKQLTSLVFIAVAVGVVLFFPAMSHTAANKDYVIVIDVSTSMQDIFDEVREAAKRKLSEATTGDNVVIITFGERATLLVRKQVRDKSDIQSLQTTLDGLYPTDYSTYLSRGLERGLSELRYLFEKNPDRERVLLWLSDDKDNPPQELGEEFLTLEDLREKNKDFEPGREWFAYDAPLREVSNEALEEFFTWARRTTFRVAVKENLIDLGSFEDGQVKKKFLVTFQPKHPGTAGLEFAAQARLIDPENPSVVIPVDLQPKRIVASAHPWQQEFQIAFSGEPGQYTGEFAFESLSGPMLDVEPRTVGLTAMIVPPKPPEVQVAEEQPKPEGLLASAKEQGIIATEDRPPGVTRPDKPLMFGPMEPGKKDNKIITLYLNKEADPDSITQDLSIQVPQGVNIESKVYGRGNKLAAEITVSVDQNAQIEESVLQAAYEGSVRFVSSEPAVEILPVYVPIRVTMNTDRVRWGPKLLPEGGTDVGRAQARRMTFEELTRELDRQQAEAEKAGPVASTLRNVSSRLSSRYVYLPLLGAVVILLALLVYRMRPASGLFSGELVVIKDPSDSKTKNINLKRIGSLQGKDTLTIGSSPRADIRLNHESVSPIHCKITAKMSENRTEISILPLKGSIVEVNDVQRTERTRLSDKDLLGIGDFILLFSAPEEQKEAVVHFLDGRTMRGTPITWDIGAASFELLRTDTSGGEEKLEDITVVNFSDLKAVFFMQDSSGSRASVPRDRINTKKLLEVTFFDGERIEGHPFNDYSEMSGRFYIVPREMPNIVSILVERAGVKEVVEREFQEPEQARPTGALGLLRKRRGEASAK